MVMMMTMVMVMVMVVPVPVRMIMGMTAVMVMRRRIGAGEQQPDLILDFATLTGAARIALGPDLPALFSNDDALANDWIAAGQRSRDPLWRMPLWRPYLRYLNSGIADLANAGSRMAGAVTAALYLERFVPEAQPWAHLDVYAWNDSDRPGRPAGGEALALRAAFEMLKTRYSA